MSSENSSVERLVLIGVGLACLLSLAFMIGFAVGEDGLAVVMAWIGRLFT
jgi:hypothetical protein